VKWVAYGLACLAGFLGYTKFAKTPLQKALTGMEPPPSGNE
jgi:hypothetical protein